jgi:hypothetical protein
MAHKKGHAEEKYETLDYQPQTVCPSEINHSRVAGNSKILTPDHFFEATKIKYSDQIHFIDPVGIFFEQAKYSKKTRGRAAALPLLP